MKVKHADIPELMKYTGFEYNFTDIAYLYQGRTKYIFLGENKIIAARDILYMNSVWNEACMFVETLPEFEFTERDINFTPIQIYDRKRAYEPLFTHFDCKSTSKSKKYPMVIYVVLHNYFGDISQSGEILYLPDGTIGRIEIQLTHNTTNTLTHTIYKVEAEKTDVYCKVNKIIKEYDFRKEILYQI